MDSKEKKIKELKDKIAYLMEKAKRTNNQVDKGLINDEILEARKEIGALESKKAERIKRVDIIDAPAVADRMNLKTSRSGNIIGRVKKEIEVK